MSAIQGQDAKAAEQVLQKERRTAQIVYLVHTLLYAAALVLAAVLKLNTIGIALGGVNMILYFVVVRRLVRGYSDDVARANILCGLCEPLKEARYTGKKGLTQEEFRLLRLMPVQDEANALLLRAGFEGKSDCALIAGHEATFHYTGMESDGKTPSRFVNGTLLTAECLQEWTSQEGEWLILRSSILDPAAKQRFLRECGYVPAQCGEARLKEDYQIYARTEGQTLSGETARRISRLTGKTKATGAIRLTRNQAAVFLCNRFYTGRTKVRVVPEAAWLSQSPLPERDMAFALLNTWCRGRKTGQHNSNYRKQEE